MDSAVVGVRCLCVYVPADVFFLCVCMCEGVCVCVFVYHRHMLRCVRDLG